MRRIALAALAALLAAIGLAACGGSGQPSADDQAFISAANAICKAAQNKLYESDGISEGASSEESKEWTTDTWVPVIAEAHEKIAALSIPQGYESQITAYLTALEDWVIAAENDPATQLTLGTPEDQNVARLAGGAGLEECEEMGK
jgi:hypothetical protein